MKKKPTKSARVKTPGYPTQTDDLHRMVNEMSLSLAESNHVETIEEANDFEINDEEDHDFFQNLTVYEMHDQAEENLRLVQQNQALAESNETGDQGADQPPHDQSAPVEPNSLEPQITSPLVGNLNGEAMSVKENNSAIAK